MSGFTTPLINPRAMIFQIVVALCMCASAAAATSKPPIKITADRGGVIIDYALRVKNAETSGRQIRFLGRCDSACTLFLALSSKRTCISTRASFGFHLPHGNSPATNAKAAKYLMDRYPTWVVRWINANGGLGHATKRMNYSYAKNHLSRC